MLAFFGNSIVIGWIYPGHATDYYEFLKYYKLRNIVYEAMFCAFFYLSFSNSSGLISAVCKFGFIVSFASFVDKVSGITWYLHSDILMVMIAFEVTLTQYLLYEHKDRRGGKIVSC